jgi:hypothetical protein
VAITARALIASTLRLLTVLASNEPMAAAEAFDGLQTLNQMLDSWANDRLLVYATVRLDVPLVPGKAVYTWGVPGGDILQPRPVQVESAVLSLQGQDLEWPLTGYSQGDYDAIAQKAMTSLYPQVWQYTSTYPLGELRVWPVPQEGHTLAVWPWMPLKRFDTLDTEVNLPPGYERALRYGLALDLAPEYGREATPALVGAFAQAFSAIKRTNTVVPTLSMDPAFSGRQAGRWDAQSDTYFWRR